MSGKAKPRARCDLCDRNRLVEANHVGGRNQVAWFTMPFCKPHHNQFHRLLEAAGVSLEYTPDEVERIARALSALQIAEHMLVQRLRELNRSERNEDPP